MLPTFSRRRLLAQVGAGAAALSFAGALPIGWGQEAPALAQPPGKKLIVRSAAPFNGEPSLAALIESYITPHSLFYVRNHGNIPQIDPATYRLRVEGLVDRPREFSLAELKQLAGDPMNIPATLTCAGNRRLEFQPAVAGVQWDAGAIGHARWTGITLASLLYRLGIKSEAQHVWFEGLDECQHGDVTTSFGASIPLDKVFAEQPSRPLLAWEMNGKLLAPEHGYPLRGVVPGYIGARSVKWLSRIVVSDRPSPNYYQAVAYKVIERDEQSAAAEPLYEFGLNSVICSPAPGSMTRGPQQQISGYALPAGDRGQIARVEVSADGGDTWTRMELLDEPAPGKWLRWRGNLAIGPEAEELVVRATDTVGRTQPWRFKWNLKGYMLNSWHRVPLG